MEELEIRRRLERYKFYPTIQLTDDFATPGTHGADPSVVNPLNADLKGNRVLDVGCRDGLYSFMAERRCHSGQAVLNGSIRDAQWENFNRFLFKTR
jgi:hypothetical protein